MRENADYALADPTAVRDLIARNPWATMFSHPPAGPVASHYPFLLEDGTDDLVLLSHVGRPDEALHQLGTRELLVVFAGPSGYVSPSWYGTGPAVPTWNFAAVHCRGIPEILPDAENLAVLERLVDRFEDPLPNPFRLRGNLENSAYAERIVGGTVGFRLRVTRVEGKDKMSQDKPAEVVERVVAALRAPGPYRNDALADRMTDVHRRRTA
ncbi:FMN-binding negative transcriptional regulator [Kineococcus sp. SYSU DK001]|uniref:FMN-binding negative transcriptional regulator n=1 Tax=Kineococcus sp. SYSU DK001 TaxID=3383122 RepID=UPI003D7E5F98